MEGASGELPTAQIWMEERSASGKASWVTMSWAIDGTRKTNWGFSSGTIWSQRPASKRGWKTPESPSCMGL